MNPIRLTMWNPVRHEVRHIGKVRLVFHRTELTKRRAVDLCRVAACLCLA